MSKRVLGFSVVLAALLVSVAALAARTERALIPGQSRFVWDSTARQLKFEVENSDRLWVSRYGFDGRRTGEFFLEDFDAGDGKGLAILEFDGTAGSGTASALNYLHLTDGNVMAAEAIGTQTILPDMDAGGLDIGGDQAADEGWEVFSHALGATGSPLVIGTTPAFSFEVGLTIGDVSGTDDLQCGLRRAETVNAAFDDYLDAATLGFNTAANPGAIKIATIDDNAATSETDTTDTLADATATNWKFFVSAAGVVTYTIDGSAPSTTAAFTFDDGDPVIPFCRFINDTALADSVTIDLWKVELQ